MQNEIYRRVYKEWEEWANKKYWFVEGSVQKTIVVTDDENGYFVWDEKGTVKTAKHGESQETATELSLLHWAKLREDAMEWAVNKAINMMHKDAVDGQN